MRILLHILGLIVSFNLIAQENKKIRILNADYTFANEKKHPEYWRLVGNVSFQHNNSIMNCDSAFHYKKENKILAFGKVYIQQGDSISLKGDKLYYFGKENKIDINGDVILIDRYMKLETDQLYYNIKTNIGSYKNHGVIIDNEKTIQSRKGSYNANLYMFNFTDSVKVLGKDYNIITNNMKYNTKSEIAYFSGPSYIISNKKTIYAEKGWYNTKYDIAELRDKSYIETKEYLLKSDTLYYHKNKGYAKAINNVKIYNTTENIKIYGGLAEYLELENKIFVSKRPVMELPFKEDTIFIHAQKFFIEQENKKKDILAYNKVKFFSEDIQGKSDSLSYSINDSTIEIYKKPIIWANDFQITADSIKLLVYDKEIKQMFLKKSPIIISQYDSIDFNQIKGKEMIVYFNKNNINRVDISGNGQSIFIVEDDKDEKIGLNYIESTDISLFFKEKKLHDITYHITPTSTTTPLHQLKEKEHYLKGINWREKERPKAREDIFIE